SRWTLIPTFSCWWVKPRGDITRGLPEEIYQQLTDEQKIVMGYCAIPPLDEWERRRAKCGYDDLRPSVKDYYPDPDALKDRKKVRAMSGDRSKQPVQAGEY